MDSTQLERLSTHITNIGYSLINELNTDGMVLVYDNKGGVYPDIVSTHHLFEMLINLDLGIFSQYLAKIVEAIVKPEYGFGDSPFVLATLSTIYSKNEKNTDLFRKTILNDDVYNDDGSNIKYNGHLRGGNFFSTLWCTNILIQYSKKEFAKEIELSLNYLINDRHNNKKRPSFLGFLGFILLKYDSKKYNDVIKDIFDNLVELPQIAFLDNTRPINGLDTIFLVEDFLAAYAILEEEKYLEPIEKILSQLFELESEPESLPTALVNYKKQSSEPLRNQILCKSVLIAEQFCKLHNKTNNAILINGMIQNNFINVRYYALEIERELKKYIELYGKMHNKFKHYDAELKNLWDETETPLNKSIFLIMPFGRKGEDKEVYDRLRDKIKAVCKKLGFTAIRADDDDRRKKDTLWENLVLNMLSCKYAIAVHTTAITENRWGEKHYFNNPNVALEYGFFKSRGHNILILKEEKASLDADMRSHLWKSFNINRIDETVPESLSGWLTQIKKEEDNNSKENNNGEEK